MADGAEFLPKAAPFFGATPRFLIGRQPRSGTARRRVRPHRRVLMLANEFLSATNWLQGHRHDVVGPARTDAHEAIRARAYDLAGSMVECLDAHRESDDAALHALLKGRSVYQTETAHTTLRSFKESLVSVPEDNWDAPALVDVLPREDSIYLERSQEHMLIPRDQWEQVLSEAGFVPYVDIVFRESRRVFSVGARSWLPEECCGGPLVHAALAAYFL